MNVLQRPRENEFCATMRDYIIDTDVTITFAVKYGGKTILDEEYVPDANNQVRVRKLGKFCELALRSGGGECTACKMVEADGAKPLV